MNKKKYTINLINSGNKSYLNAYSIYKYTLIRNEEHFTMARIKILIQCSLIYSSTFKLNAISLHSISLMHSFKWFKLALILFLRIFFIDIIALIELDLIILVKNHHLKE